MASSNEIYAQAAIKQNSIRRNGATDIVMRGVQKCTRGCSSLRGRKKLPLCCIKLDTATDPFCGCGTTLVAAKRLNREYIGFEINEEYYNNILLRMESNE